MGEVLLWPWSAGDSGDSGVNTADDEIDGHTPEQGTCDPREKVPTH